MKFHEFSGLISRLPEAGGTGHTIRVCRNAGVPVIFQNHWVTWIPTHPHPTPSAEKTSGICRLPIYV